jgi:hypothetical protein
LGGCGGDTPSKLAASTSATSRNIQEHEAGENGRFLSLILRPRGGLRRNPGAFDLGSEAVLMKRPGCLHIQIANVVSGLFLGKCPF